MPEALVHPAHAFPRLALHVVEDDVFGRAYVGVRRNRRDDPGVAFRLVPHPRVERTANELGSRRGEQRAPRHPSVVDDAVGNLLVVVLEQRPELLALGRPRDVVPQHAGPVSSDELTNLRLGVRGVVGTGDRVEHLGDRSDRPVVERRVEPARVVDPEAHPDITHGLAQLADDVAPAVPAGATRIGNAGRPHAVAVHVLGHEHDIPGTRGGEPRRPIVRIPLIETGFPIVGELRVRAVAVDLAMVAGDRTARETATSSRTTPRTARTRARRAGPTAPARRCRRRRARTPAPMPASSARRSRASRPATRPAPDDRAGL